MALTRSKKGVEDSLNSRILNSTRVMASRHCPLPRYKTVKHQTLKQKDQIEPAVKSAAYKVVPQPEQLFEPALQVAEHDIELSKKTQEFAMAADHAITKSDSTESLAQIANCAMREIGRLGWGRVCEALFKSYDQKGNAAAASLVVLFDMRVYELYYVNAGELWFREDGPET
ncbi:hypothetical protein LTR41_012074, partial [Exophiala xenobiotica]